MVAERKSDSKGQGAAPAGSKAYFQVTIEGLMMLPDAFASDVPHRGTYVSNMVSDDAGKQELSPEMFEWASLLLRSSRSGCGLGWSSAFRRRPDVHCSGWRCTSRQGRRPEFTQADHGLRQRGHRASRARHGPQPDCSQASAKSPMIPKRGVTSQQGAAVLPVDRRIFMKKCDWREARLQVQL